MENPAKKLKLSDEDASSDPFATLHENLHQYIFQYLSGKDVMNAFLVSKQWNRIASESSAAMEKIQLKFLEKSATNPSPREVTALLQSERQYQNIDAEFRYLANAGRKLLLLQRFSPSIVELTVRFYNKKLAPLLLSDLSFPKLKALDVMLEGSLTQFYLKQIGEATDLEKLTINTDDLNAELFNCIKQRKKLKDLKLISGTRELSFGTDSLHDAQFELTSLTFADVWFRPSDYLGTNFETFVLQMAKTLQTLYLSRCRLGDLNLVLSKLPALKRFKVDAIQGGDPMQLKPNNTIKELKCYYLCNTLKQVLAFFTGLEVLEVSNMNKENFKWIARNVKGLKKLQIISWEGRSLSALSDSGQRNALENVQTFYNQIKEENPEINGNIEVFMTITDSYHIL